MTFEFKYEPSTPEPSPTENLIVSFTGSRFNKTKRALVDLGPAIANAGMTTFLAVIILPASSSHVFLTFFKVGILSSVWCIAYNYLHSTCLLLTKTMFFSSDFRPDRGVRRIPRPRVSPRAPLQPRAQRIWLRGWGVCHGGDRGQLREQQQGQGERGHHHHFGETQPLE